MGNERGRSENANRVMAEHRHWAGVVLIAEEEEEDEEAWQRGQNFVAVGSVKPAIASLDLRVISVPKAKKKPKKRRK